MGRIYQCVGRYAETAYTIKRTWIRVYCVEELCYYICNNAYLLEEDFISQDMLSWLDSECALSDLVKNIRWKSRQGGGLEEQIRMLLEEVHYCSADEINDVINMIAANRNMNPMQKMKIRADYFLKNQRYALALRVYEELQGELENEEDHKLCASVFYNMGVIYAHLFLMEQAGEYFKLACEQYEKEEYKTAYLAAMRLVMPEADYLKWVAQDQTVYEASNNLETTLEQIGKDWTVSGEYMKYKETERLRRQGRYESFVRQMDQQNRAYRELYRNMMME